MPLLILLTLIGVPYLEILIFMEVGNAIGGFQAFLLTLLTAGLGIYLIKQQGLVVMNRMQETLQRGESPVEDLSQGFFLLVAGLFYLLPGFLTDSLAVLLSLSPVRTVLGKIILSSLSARFYQRSPGQNHTGPSPNAPGPNAGQGEGIIIDGEFEENPEDQKNPQDQKNLSHKD